MVGEETSVAAPSAGESDRPSSGLVYSTEGVGKELRQGEIITNVAHYVYDPVSGRASETYQYGVAVCTQDCDLLWDYERQQKGEESDLNEVILYPLISGDEVEVAIKGREIWKRIKQNKDERYHYLAPIPSFRDLSSIGLPALVIDFKAYFSMPSKELYRQCNLGHGAIRRCRLEMPYREHLQNRIAIYQQRVGLPYQHSQMV